MFYNIGPDGLPQNGNTGKLQVNQNLLRPLHARLARNLGLLQGPMLQNF